MSSLPTLRQMLESGVHFGHVKSRWNPKMKPYIFTTRDSVHVINLEKTRQKLDEALNYLGATKARGGIVLFVGTKRQAHDLVRQTALDTGMPFVTTRWLGGTLTNFDILRKNVKTLQQIEDAEAKGQFDHKTKKERLKIEEKQRKLANILEGLRDMQKLPEVILVVDTVHENLAVSEARSLGIPVVAIVDTNANPDQIDYPIPANDDAHKSLALILSSIATTLQQAHTPVEKLEHETVLKDQSSPIQTPKTAGAKSTKTTKTKTKPGKDTKKTA